MKKLLVLLMLMGLVTTVKAQSTSNERDYIMEQVIHSVSSLKSNSAKVNAWLFKEPDFSESEELGFNPFQYIRQQADYISIASTVSFYGGDEILTTRKEVDLESNHLLGTSAEVMYGGSEDHDCIKNKKSHIQ